MAIPKSFHNALIIFLMCLFIVPNFNCSSTPHLSTIPMPDASVFVDYDAYVVPQPDLNVRSLNNDNVEMPDGAVQASITRGQIAPFSGVLLSVPAIAAIEAEYIAAQQRRIADGHANTERMAAQAVRDLRHLETSMEAQRIYYNLSISLRDREVESLRSASTSILPAWAYILGGTLLGTSLTAFIFSLFN